MSARQRSSSVTSISSNHSMYSSTTPSVLPPQPPPPPILPSQPLSHGGGSAISTPTTMHSPIFPPHPIQGHNIAPTPNTARSMSIVSLESPRNSIISFDEVIRPHTRNNSSTSLVSLTSNAAGAATADTTTVTGTGAGMTTPITNEYVMSKRLKSGIVLLSDEESESEITHTPTRSIIRPIFKLRRKSRETSDQHNQFLQLKRDFKLKFDELISTTTQASSSPTSLLPTSPSTTVPHLIASPNIDANPIQLDSSLELPPPSHKKKSKPNTLIQQSMLIKRKLAISKDLQLELLNSISPMTTLPQASPTPPPNDLLDSKIFNAHKIQQPIMQALSEQNELIKKLNRRWNKAIINPKDTNTNDGNNKKDVVVNSRKRSRRISFEDESSGTTTGGYESYDDYYDIYDE